MYTHIYMHTHSHPFYVHVNDSAGARDPSWLPNLRSGTLDVIVCGEHLVAMDCTGPASSHRLPFSQFISSSLNLRHTVSKQSFFLFLYILSFLTSYFRPSSIEMNYIVYLLQYLLILVFVRCLFNHF